MQRRKLRKRDTCGRCGIKPRRRSDERRRRTGVYACMDCDGTSEGKATLLRVNRGKKPLRTIWDFSTAQKFKIDLLHLLFRISLNNDERSTSVIVGTERFEGFANHARSYGIECKDVNFLEDEDRRQVIAQEISLCSGEEAVLIGYSGRYITQEVSDLLDRATAPVMMVADGQQAIDWERDFPSLLIISPEELPKRR